MLGRCQRDPSTLLFASSKLEACQRDRPEDPIEWRSRGDQDIMGEISWDIWIYPLVIEYMV